jgi:LppX_LprAFG lipoprotein
MSRLRILLAGAAAVGLLVTGCGGGSGGGAAAADEGPARLAAAKAAVDAASSLHFTLTSTGVPATGTALVGGEGSAARPGRFQGDLKVLFAGTTATVGVVSVDGTVYAKLPFATGYAKTDPAQFGFADPGRFMDPATGISNLLVKATDVKVGKESRVGSDVVQEVTGTLPGMVVKDLLADADPSVPVAARFDVVKGSGQLRQAVLTGPFFAAGTPSTFTLVLDRYGEPVDIRAPTTS